MSPPPLSRDQRQRGVGADQQAPEVHVEHAPPARRCRRPSTGPSSITPALLTSTSRRAVLAVRRLDERARLRLVATSTSWTDGVALEPLGQRRRDGRGAGRRARPWRPRATRAVAVASPIPDEAPVIAATRPARGASAIAEPFPS